MRTIGKLIVVLIQAEQALRAEWEKRASSDGVLEAKIGRMLLEESEQYLSVLSAWQTEHQETVAIRRDDSAWQALRELVDTEWLWHQHDLLRQIEASLVASTELAEQAKKSYPYGEEQLFLEGLIHEKKKSRRKAEELLRYVQNRIWEEIGFAPYLY